MANASNGEHLESDRGADALPPERRSRWDREDLDANTLRGSIESVGSGPPIVFLHGLLGLNRHWTRTASRLADHSRCVMIEAPLLELRGRRCSIEGVQAIIRQEIVDAINEPAVLVGNSLGGHIALRLALSDPHMVRGLVLAGASGLFERTFERDVQHRPSQEWINRKIADLFADPSRMPEDAVTHAYTELRKRGSARALVRLSRSAKADHMGSRLPGVNVPTLLLWGRQDRVVPLWVGQKLARDLPRAELVVLEDCGHMPAEEAPEASFATVDRFLSARGSSVHLKR